MTSREPTPQSADVVVIGGGFGGLATALRLAEHGADVVLAEALNYPGGCASTFSRDGYRFESGATLFSGFGEHQLFRTWIDRYHLPITIDWLDPVVDFRAQSFSLQVPRSRDAFVATLLDDDAVPGANVERFFELQRGVADVLWSTLDSPELLPPFGLAAALRHARRLGRYLPLVPLLGRTLEAVLDRFDVPSTAKLRLYLDALCQITVQCPASEAEALFALGTMDYYFRGTGHVRGGIGELAWGLVQAIEQAGGSVLLANRVSRIERHGNGYRVRTRRGVIETRTVAANVLPQSLGKLTGEATEGLPVADRLARDVETGWGACMLYRVVAPPAGAGPRPHHLQLVDQEDAPLQEGNHVFCSISGSDDRGRAPEGLRTMTVSPHVPMEELRRLPAEAQGEYVSSIQNRMRKTLRTRAPEWEQVHHELTASPRTFERFTSRDFGYVGGVPRRAGLHNYRGMGPTEVRHGLYLVGDTVFPGQSTLATALGGYKLAERLAGAVRIPGRAQNRLDAPALS